ncbi:putative protein tag-52 [Aplysia californica]|uniref:DH domain-containing protein n=1 Tax=Aplysia californica TaxID=6500 RepID=A0ABM0JR17_APLCA|nr:putative protein tag-52 [Aplysia californica]
MSLSGEAVLFASSPSDKKAQEAARRERKRRKVVKELFETEKTYLHHLELVHKFFDFPLRFACLVPDDVHARLFSNLEQIREVNATLQEQMEQSTVGQAFSQLGPFLKLYSLYANNHQSALNTLQEWQQKSTEFAEFVSRQESRPEVMGLKLPALLITPVQRIPRYKLLLEELLNSTPVEHHDYEKLREAADKLAEIASHINEHIRQNENFMKMLAIQRSFDSSAPKLLAPGRQFIKEGPLKKMSRKGGKSFERMFFLFSDILLYGKPKFLDGGGRSYTCSCVLPLRHCKVEPVFITNFSKSDAGGVFKITCKEESLVLYSEDQGNAKEWSAQVEKAIRKLCDDRQTLRKPSSNKIPLRGRSLRKHRQKQKKTDIKIPGKTPLRPLSQVSNFSEDNEDSDSSPMVKARLDPLRRHFRQAYSNDLSQIQDTTGVDENDSAGPGSPQGSPVLRKKKRVDTTASSDDISGVSLSDESGSMQDSVSYRSSLRSGDSQESISGVSTAAAGQQGDARQSLRQYSFSLRGSRGQLEPGHVVKQRMTRSQENIADGYDEEHDIEQHQHPAVSSLVKSTALTSSSASVWFPPNSPAHKYQQRKTINMKLRSYFKRFKKARKDMTDHCSPFKPTDSKQQARY